MNTLAELPVGASARVKAVDGVDDIAVRLMEMGLTPGIEVQVVGMALLGDPIELEVRGYRLSLRKTEAKRIQI